MRSSREERKMPTGLHKMRTHPSCHPLSNWGVHRSPSSSYSSSNAGSDLGPDALAYAATDSETDNLSLSCSYERPGPRNDA